MSCIGFKTRNRGVQTVLPNLRIFAQALRPDIHIHKCTQHDLAMFIA